ncbi:MAG TPA: AAA family ATPase [Anaerolineae bacterium]|nr:AAA family ATPase [Anaerolineae bacterium]
MSEIEMVQRPLPEQRYGAELAQLREEDAGLARPPGWQLTPRSVLAFVLGDEGRGIAPKFVGSRRFVERCVVALATQRGLMLIGEPGTAKSYLSELLAAGISGDSTLTIQGSAGTTEDTIKYSWNYALLLAEGATERSLVAAPLYLGMEKGQIVRFEEITRCPLEIQDTLLSVLSERAMVIPEFSGSKRMLLAQAGFNVIATANTRDRGVNEMSAALKRRFNFETVQPIPDWEAEKRLIERETAGLLAAAGIPLRLSGDITSLLVATFQALRTGRTAGGRTVERVSTVMSTAEAVAVGYAAGVHAYYYDDEQAVRPAHLVQSLLGSALKDSDGDRAILGRYFEEVVKRERDGLWPAYYAGYVEMERDG